MAEKKDTPPERNRTALRIVNLRHITGDTWQVMPPVYQSSAHALKGQPQHGEGTYQRATFFGETRTLKAKKMPDLLVEDTGEIDAQPAPEADDDD